MSCDRIVLGLWCIVSASAAATLGQRALQWLLLLLLFCLSRQSTNSPVQTIVAVKYKKERRGGRAGDKDNS